MKKNIMTVVIMALGIVNLILTAVVIFTVVPNVKKTNNLIDKVSQIIELDLEAQNGNQKVVKEENLVNLNLDENLVINLVNDEGSSKEHYASIDKITITLFDGATNYSKAKSSIEESSSVVCNMIRKGFSIYRKDEAKVHEDAIKKDIIRMLNEKYGDQVVYDITFGSLVFQ